MDFFNTQLMLNTVIHQNWDGTAPPWFGWVIISLVVISLIILLARYIRNDLRKGKYD